MLKNIILLVSPGPENISSSYTENTDLLIMLGGLTWLYFVQTVLAPPDVQQQYLSSIQHLLGDGKTFVYSL